MTFTYTKLMFSFLHLMLCSAALSLEFSWTRSIYSSSLLFHPSPFLSCRTSDFCTKPSCISHIFFLQHFFAHSFLRNFISLPTHSARSLYFMIFVYFVNSAIVATYDAASIVYCSDETDTLTAIFHTDDHHPSSLPFQPYASLSCVIWFLMHQSTPIEGLPDSTTAAGRAQVTGLPKQKCLCIFPQATLSTFSIFMLAAHTLTERP
ncbi:hypothetical protein KP509_23G040400 [Ceratopteris richardii]|uniref:Secreted protein n=1 Tax=Ceratopteris richardii TaxID=49495 RepID=A0A8T2RZ10_CERRI|nr:hypothetical protein KP509_23G040400 [Ceratopteris richardii]